jgi:ribosomal protein S18 acetylase RimI-like enzyme
MSVRQATADDVPRLKEIFSLAAWSNEGDRPLLTEHPEFLEWSGDPAREGRTRVAAIDGQLVGFLSTIDNGDTTEIEDLFVDPAWMRRGVATALVDDAANAHGALVVDANRHALAFYESAGFVIEGEVALDVGTALRMRRDA